MANFKKIEDRRGFSIIEIAVVVAIAGVALIGILSVVVYSLRAQVTVRQSMQAAQYAKDAIEAVKSYRGQTSWDINGIGTLAAGANYHPALATDNASSSWTMALGAETIGPFSRTIVFDRISRDPSSKNIESAYNAANDDPESRKMTVTLSWSEKNIQMTTYITNWLR